MFACCMLHVCTLHVACCCGAKSIRTRSAAADPTGSDGGTDHCEWRGRHRADQSDGDTWHAAATRRNEVHARMPSLSAKTKFKQNHAQSRLACSNRCRCAHACVRVRNPSTVPRRLSARRARGGFARNHCAARPQCSRWILTSTNRRTAWSSVAGAGGRDAPGPGHGPACAGRHLGYLARFCHRRRVHAAASATRAAHRTVPP